MSGLAVNAPILKVKMYLKVPNLKIMNFQMCVSVITTQTKIWNTLKGSLIPTLQSLSGSLLPKSDFYHYRLVLPNFELHINRIIHYVLYSVWLALCVILCINIYSFLLLSSISLYGYTMIYLSVLL